MGSGFNNDDDDGFFTVNIYHPDTNKWDTIDSPHAAFAMTVLIDKLLIVGGVIGVVRLLTRYLCRIVANGKTTQKCLQQEVWSLLLATNQ